MVCFIIKFWSFNLPSSFSLVVVKDGMARSKRERLGEMEALPDLRPLCSVDTHFWIRDLAGNRVGFSESQRKLGKMQETRVCSLREGLRKPYWT